MVENQICVNIKIYSWLSGALLPGNESALLLEEALPQGSSLRACFIHLSARFARFDDIIFNPQEDCLQPQVVLTHNGKLLTGTDRLEMVLQEGDSISLIPAYAGG